MGISFHKRKLKTKTKIFLFETVSDKFQIMGQQLFKIQFEENEKKDSTSSEDGDSVKSCIENDSISFLFPWKIDYLLKKTNDSNLLIEQIQKNLLYLTHLKDSDEINKQINEILLETVLKFLENNSAEAMKQITDNWNTQQQLQKTFNEKLKEEENNLIFFSNDDNHQKLVYLSLQSLISILLILIKSAEKHDSTIIEQILFLTNQLSEQLPLKCLSTLNYSNDLFKSLKPLISFIEQLSFSSDKNLSKQSIQILIHLSIAKGSFEDILSLLTKLIFDKNHFYSINNLIEKLNKNLPKESIQSLNYLQSINLNEREFNGEIISSILLSYTDLFTYEYQPNTFKQLFNIIEQIILSENSFESNQTLDFILNSLIKLFLIHLEYLFNSTTNIYQIFFPKDKNHLENIFTNDELTKWFELFSKISLLNSNEILLENTSKILFYIIDQQTKTFEEKLIRINQLIIENEFTYLIKECFNQLKKDVFILNWIEILCNNNQFDILNSLLEKYFIENNQQLEDIFISFEYHLFYRLIEQSKKENNDEQISLITNLILKFISLIFQNCKNENILLNNILIGLSLMTKIDQILSFQIVQPIFNTVLPLLSEYLLTNSTNNSQLICWLMGKMSQILIVSLPLNSIEKNCLNELNSLLFIGGCERSDFETSSDGQLLLSICNNQNEGKRLITKVKLSLKTKPNSFPKSLEEQIENSCAAIFSVYIKFYRRLNLVKFDLSRPDEEKIHPSLLSLYRYTNSIHNHFIKLKGQGGNCEAFSLEIHNRCVFLLLNLKENDLIPIIDEEYNLKKKDKIHFQRQISRWTKAKYIIRLLRNLLNACIRFKKFMLAKKSLLNNEQMLHKIIQDFLFEKDENMKFDLINLKQCFQKQDQRAIIRLSSYQFIQAFIIKLSQLNNKNNLIIYLKELINSRIEWSYLENILNINYQLKNEISKCYYSILFHLIDLTKFQYENFNKILFNLLNFSYQSEDILSLYDYQIIQILFEKFFHSNQLTFLSFNWFQLFFFKLSQNTSHRQIKDLFFNQYLLNQFKQNLTNIDQSKDCIENITYSWFIHSSTLNINLYLNQLLVLFYECLYLGEDICLICANFEMIKQILTIYSQSENWMTKLLVLKVLGELICYFRDDCSKNVIEQFLNESLVLIGENILSENESVGEINELVSIYRRILSTKCPWQNLGIELIIQSLNLNENENKKLIGSLCVLGGYIQPFYLTSIVKIFNQKDKIDKFKLGIIIQKESSSYQIKYFDKNENESVEITRLKHGNDLLSLNILLFPNSIHFIFDQLAEFIQMNTNSQFLYQIKSRAILTLFYLLNNQQLIEIFMEKSYASSIAKLTLPSSIDRSLSSKESDLNLEENLFEYLSSSRLKSNQWKSFVTKKEYQLFNQGRLGDNQLEIISIPENAVQNCVFEECGNKHRFNGRICSTPENTNVKFPTFILKNVRVKEGNWYYCVKIIVPNLIQIGWGTDGITPGGENGIGDDIYSWSYDGSRSSIFYNEQQFANQFNDVVWKENDILGCGIEIHQENIQIKYWLNGTFLGIAFEHQKPISSSTTICNLLPNQSKTTFFPGLTLQSYCTPPTTCQFIFSPEDMEKCPLPDGYKPLLLPKIIHLKNGIVAYPYSAYLIGDHFEDYFYKTRIITSKTYLRDFVNECHLETDFNCDQSNLILPETSLGFPLEFDKDLSAFTITLDLEIVEQQSKEIQLLTTDIEEKFSVQISLEEKNRIVIIVNRKEEQIKIYKNQECQTFDFKVETQTIHLLPKIHAKICNLAIWKYALSDEHIQRLFTYGLSYISIDYQQLKEHRKQMNTFSFVEHQFSSENLIPFDQPFNQDIWEQKKKQADQNELKYFQSSIIQFYGNQTYLILDKSDEQWSEYTIILDICIPNWPKNTNERLSLIQFNSKGQLFITNEGKLCLEYDQRKDESSSSLPLNEFFRLFVVVNKESVLILFGSVAFSVHRENDQFAAKLNRIELFRENDLTKNTTENDILRIQCQSITFLNQIIDFDQDIKQVHSSLDQLIAPSFSMISPSLLAIGYKESWIKSVMKEYKTTNIQMIDTIILEQKDQLIKTDFENEQKRYFEIFSRLYPSIDREKLSNYFMDTSMGINEQIEWILSHWEDFRRVDQIDEINDQISSEENRWFSETIQHLDIHQNLTEWINDKSSTVKPVEEIVSPSTSNQQHISYDWFGDDDDYDDEPESPDLFRLITNFEQTENKNSQQEINYKLVDLIHEERENIEPQDHLTSKEDLITIYARLTIDNMLTIWSKNSNNLFPLHKFGDNKFLVQLLRIMNQHNSSTDQMSLAIKSILKLEIEQILNSNISTEEKESFLFFHLQNNVLVQLIRFLIEPSLLNENFEEEAIRDKQPNLNFIFKILNIFIQLIKEKSLLNQSQIDQIIQYFFPQTLINLLFDLFLIVPTHQSKIFILRLYST